MHFMFPTSLPKKIAMLTMLVTAAVAISTAVLAVTSSDKIMFNKTTDDLERIAEGVYLGVNQIIHSGQDTTHMLAFNPTLRSASSTPEQKLREMEQTQAVHPGEYENITLVAPTGKVITSTNYNFLVDWKSDPSFRQARQGTFVVSPPFVDPEPFKLLLRFMGPVYDESGVLTGVVVLQFDMKNIWQLTDSFTIGETGVVMVVDEDFRILAYPNKDQILMVLGDDMIDDVSTAASSISAVNEGRVLVGNYYNEQKSSSAGQFAEHTETHWTTIVVQDSTEAFAGSQAFVIKTTLATLVFLVFAWVMSAQLSRRITKPIEELVRGTEEIINGNLSYVIHVVEEDEIGRLGRMFNAMASKLRNSYGSLHAEVQARTQELESIKTHLEEEVERRIHEVKALNSTLEKRIAERTGELEKKVTELERLNARMTDRELRMIELKKQLAALKK
jgi:HAMP domain-containing protein